MNTRRFETPQQDESTPVMTSQHAVIIPHFNDADRLRRCLSALVTSDLSETEIVVVDNASTQPLDGLRHDFPMVRFITEPSKGAAHARNRGVRETAAKDLFFLDADCLPDADWLATARRRVGLADLVGGAIGVFDETPPPRTGAQAFETVFAFNYRDYILNKGFSVTANLLTRRAVFEDVGPFIDGVSEDAEWCLRARSKGYRIALAEDLRVSHPTRSDWPALVRKWRRLTEEMFQLHCAGSGASAGRASWAARSVLVAASGVLHQPRLWRSSKLGGTGERLRGSVTLLRLRLLRAAWMIRQSLGFPIR
jgi:GT2 family glycosyltransferase